MTWLEELQSALPGRVRTSASDCEQHGRDAAHGDALPPDAVAYPDSTEDVAALIRICAKHGRPVIPYGVGTSLERHVAAPHGGLCIDLSKLDRVLDVNAADMDAHVQAGVTREQLNAELRAQGLFFPIDPGANATLGGMAATRASGTNAVRYGTMRSAVMGLTVVTPAGEIVHTGGRARKSSAGYDLTAVYVGSEGTLGVITELRVRLHALPERIAAAVVQFPALGEAIEAVIEVLQLAIPVARIEFLDALQMRAVNAHAGLTHRELPTLFLEFHGGRAAVDEQVEQVRAIANEHGGSEFQWAERPEDRTRLWKARHEAFWAARALRPGAQTLTTDVCVPISRLADCVLETHADYSARGLLAPMVGHVGDGNFHSIILYDAADPRESESAHAASAALIERALAMGGTCTGEHGIGMGKREALADEHPSGLATMRALKQALDPAGIMNPGKIFL